jgi:rhamnosyltransferase
MDKIGAVIVTYNIGDQILDTVDSILNQVAEVVIVDNHSDDKTQRLLDQLQATEKVIVIRNAQNLGIAKALNQGIEFFSTQQCDWIMTLDHDSMASADMVQNLLEVYAQLDEDVRLKVAIMAPEIFDKNLNIRTRAIKSGEFGRVNNVIQSGSLYKREKLTELGPFDENLFIYFVDDEFNKRIKLNGYFIFMVKKAVLFHEEGKKSNKKILGRNLVYDQNSGLAKYYIVRNSVYMFKKFKEKRYIERILVELIKVLLVEPRKTGYILKGIHHGIINRLGEYKP